MKLLLAVALALAVLALPACDDDKSPALPAQQTTQGSTGATGANDPEAIRERANWGDGSLQTAYDEQREQCSTHTLRQLARDLKVRPDPERVARAETRDWAPIFRLPVYAGCRRGLIQTGQASERDFR